MAYVNNLTVENLLTFLRRVCVPEYTTTSTNGVSYLTNASSTVQFIVGTASGHTFRMPDATTVPPGCAYEFYNQSSQSVLVNNYSGNRLFDLPSNSISFVILQSSGTQNGVWVPSITNQLGGGTGVAPMFVFSKSGGCAVGAYLYVGQTVTSKAGQIAPNMNRITQMTATNDANVASNTVIQLQRRTGVSSFSDITGANITIPGGTYRAVADFSPGILIGPDWEIACYNKSGASLSNPIVIMIMVAA